MTQAWKDLEKRVSRNENDVVSIYEILGDVQRTVKRVEHRVDEHSAILNEHSSILNEHSSILSEHSSILNEHSSILNEHSSILNEHTATLASHGGKLDEILELLRAR